MNDLKQIDNALFLYHFFRIDGPFAYHEAIASTLQLIAEAAQTDATGGEHPAVEVINGAGITLLRFLAFEMLKTEQAEDPVVCATTTKGMLTWLSSKITVTPSTATEFVATPFFTEATYDETEDNWVNIRMRWEVWSKLREAVRPFSREELRTLAGLKSVAALSFYSFLRLQPSTFTLSADEIRAALGIGNCYSRFHDLKKKVLTPVMKELRTTPHPFSFKKSTTNQGEYEFTV